MLRYSVHVRILTDVYTYILPPLSNFFSSSSSPQSPQRPRVIVACTPVIYVVKLKVLWSTPVVEEFQVLRVNFRDVLVVGKNRWERYFRALGLAVRHSVHWPWRPAAEPFILGMKAKVLKRSSLGVGVGDAIRKIYSGAWIQYLLKILYARKQVSRQIGSIWYVSPST